MRTIDCDSIFNAFDNLSLVPIRLRQSLETFPNHRMIGNYKLNIFGDGFVKNRLGEIVGDENSFYCVRFARLDQ